MCKMLVRRDIPLTLPFTMRPGLFSYFFTAILCSPSLLYACLAMRTPDGQFVWWILGIPLLCYAGAFAGLLNFRIKITETAIIYQTFGMARELALTDIERAVVRADHQQVLGAFPFMRVELHPRPRMQQPRLHLYLAILGRANIERMILFLRRKNFAV